ncbi:hypothetical protein QCN29_25930 [Streptomyces sp. HNM0663]|uniref:Uncharacterized protein n=1 Tax=Streptomyces chengmaiensis TaxID=3040919 RepID=A0ABT6HTW3_9ACTN|nr:hypothetical protein [Streptomyces chengmaiensis]MDH2392159.1 hypothetical protein [Streptomyces chengmaiensis]
MNAPANDTRRRGTPAAVLAAAVQGDPQFRVPERPQLCRGLHIVDTPEGVVVDGAAERQHLRGASAAVLRQTLLPLLDGTRDHAALAEATGWSLKAVGQAVATLYFGGVLEDAEQAVALPEGTGPSSSAAIWMSRTLDCSRVHAHSSLMAQAALWSRVRLAVRESWRAPLRAALADLGITDVSQATPASAKTLASDALVVVDLAAPADTVDRMVEATADRGLRLLLVDERDGRVLVGPLVDPTATACARCARAAVGPESDPVLWESVPTAGSMVAAGLIAEEVRALLLRNEPAQSLGGQLAVDLANATTSVYKLTPETDCPTCYPTSAERTDPLPAAPLHYEHAVGFPPRHLVNPKAHQHHFRPENVGLQFEHLRYPSNPRQPLPELNLAELQALSAAEEPADWPTVLAAALRFTAGLRAPSDAGEATDPGRVNRWSPSGGNLGSCHAYAVLRGVPGLADGIHYYDAAAHALTAMHPHADYARAVLTALGAPPDKESGVPDVYLVLASDIGRVARKYGPFSYRVGNLDTGCALAQLGLVSSATRTALRLLDPHVLQPHRETVTGVSGPALLTAAVQLRQEGSAPCR